MGKASYGEHNYRCWSAEASEMSHHCIATGNGQSIFGDWKASSVPTRLWPLCFIGPSDQWRVNMLIHPISKEIVIMESTTDIIHKHSDTSTGKSGQTQLRGNLWLTVFPEKDNCADLFLLEWKHMRHMPLVWCEQTQYISLVLYSMLWDCAV
jgi:hypothetical protein